MIDVVQWGRRNDFGLSIALERHFDVHTHYAHHTNHRQLNLYSNYKRFYIANHLISAMGYDASIDWDQNVFLAGFLNRVSKRLNGDCLISVSNGLQIHNKISSELRIHEQVSCRLQLAQVRNEFGANYDLDRIHDEEELLFSKVPNIIAPSEHVANYVRGFGYDNNIVVAPYAIPQSTHKKKLVSNNRTTGKIKNVLFVGRFEEAKGSKIIFDLAHNYPNIYFNVCGKNHTTYKELPNLIHHGHVAKPTLESFYLNADLFVFPSMSEGCSLAANEALHYGIPALVSRQSGSLYSNNLGYILDAFNAQDWLDTFNYMLSKKETKRFAENFSQFNQNYDFSEYEKRVVGFVRDIIK